MSQTAMKDGVTRFKRALILSAAAKLFSERGYAATTIDAITDELGASRRVIYDHFAGKAEILAAICEQAVQFSSDLAERVAREPGPPQEKLGRLARDFAAIVIDNQDYITIGATEVKFLPADSQRRILRMQEKFHRILVGILTEGAASGACSVSDPAMTALAISGMIIWTHRWYRARGRLTAAEVAQQMADAALRMAGSA